jgi:hypothetical protein
VVASTRGVRVQNVFSSYALTWGEIERFDVGRCGIWPAVLRIHTREGRVLMAWGVQETNADRLRPPARRPAARIAGLLEEERAARRPGAMA